MAPPNAGGAGRRAGPLTILTRRVRRCAARSVEAAAEAPGDHRDTAAAAASGGVRQRHAPCFRRREQGSGVGGTMNDQQISRGAEAAGAVPRERRTAMGAEHGFVEPRVRRLVAENLGVDAEELSLDVSLVDDLAADS